MTSPLPQAAPSGEAAHTKGPWEIRPGYGLLKAEIGPTHRAVATVWVKTAETRDEQKEPIAWPEGEANARLIAAAPELLAEIENEYTALANFRNHWPERHTLAGQAKLIRLRDLICKATGRDPQDVQDDYGTRIARAAATGQKGE